MEETHLPYRPGRKGPESGSRTRAMGPPPTPAFDLLAGTDAWRRRIEAGASPRDLAATFPVHEAEQRSRIAEYGLY